MRKNVGKRIIEIAELRERLILFLFIILGITIILAGLILWIGTGTFWIFLLSIPVGAVIIFLGTLVAELSTIKLYSYGIIVDKIEHLRSDLFTYEAPPSPLSRPQTQNNSQYAFSGKKTQWYCSCGYHNPGTAKECLSCGCTRPDCP